MPCLRDRAYAIARTLAHHDRRTTVTVTAAELARRTIRRADLVAAENAFIDCRTPGLGEEAQLRDHRLGRLRDRPVRQPRRTARVPARRRVDAAGRQQLAAPALHRRGVHRRRRHLHVPLGAPRVEGEYVGGPGDIISIPTWIFRGFSNVGGDDNFIFTILGRDETGGLIWHPDVLRQAEGHGLHLTVANTLIDEVAGDVLTDDVELVAPLRRRAPRPAARVLVEEMRARVTTDADRQFVDDALLCTAVPGGRARLALGHRLRHDRAPRPRTAAARPARVRRGRRARRSRARACCATATTSRRCSSCAAASGRSPLNDDDPRRVRLGVHDTLSVPPGAWRSIVNVSDDADAEIVVINGGDGRTRLEWAADVVDAGARRPDVGLDANGYLAPWSLIRHSVAPRADVATADGRTAPAGGRRSASLWSARRLSRDRARSTSAVRVHRSPAPATGDRPAVGGDDRRALGPALAPFGARRGRSRRSATRLTRAAAMAITTSGGRSPAGRSTSGQFVGTAISSAPASGEVAGHLGELEVVADRHADPADRGVDDRRRLVAGDEPLLLAIPQVGLAVHGEHAVAVDDGRAVVHRPSPARSANPPTTTATGRAGPRRPTPRTPRRPVPARRRQPRRGDSNT